MNEVVVTTLLEL